MTFKIKSLIIVLITGAALVSCKKEGCTDPTALNYEEKAKKDDGTCEYAEDPAPDIHIHEPSSGTMFGLGDTVFIEAHITYEESMHGYGVFLKNETTGDTVLQIEEHTHASNYMVDTFWINNVSVHSDMQLTIRAQLDHTATDFAEKSVDFHCHPM